MADALLSTQDFAAKIRAKYPGAYDSLSDDELTSRIVQKYPEYKSVVNFGLSSATRQAIRDNPPNLPDRANQGVVASLKRTGSGLVHLPGAVIDAFTKDPQNEDEKRSLALGGWGNLGMQRLISHPMAAEHVKAQQLHTQAALEEMEGQHDVATNFWTGTEHKANMHDIASFVPILGPMSADIVDRFTGGDKAGAITDLATAIAGPKIAEGGLNLAGKIAGKLVDVPATAQKLYQSALKPSLRGARGPQNATNAVRAGLENEIPVSEAGSVKLGNLIDDLQAKVKAEIASNPGATINKFDVTRRLGDTAKTFSNQVNPASDLSAISEAGNEFLSSQPGKISAADAQALKQGTYQQLKGRAYGELKSATVESQKALARGLKEELETQFPQLKGLNAQEAKLIGLDKALDQALGRIGNHQLISLGTPVMAAAGGVLGETIGQGAKTATAAGLLKMIVDNPIVKSKLAIALNKAGRGAVPFGAAAGQVSRYSNALAQSIRSDSEGQANAVPLD